LLQGDAELRRVAKQIVRYTAGDCKIEKLPTIESLARTSGFDGPINNQRE
jgi:hypothetical protein